jgi:hypothetical protein
MNFKKSKYYFVSYVADSNTTTGRSLVEISGGMFSPVHFLCPDVEKYIEKKFGYKNPVIINFKRISKKEYLLSKRGEL